MGGVTMASARIEDGHGTALTASSASDANDRERARAETPRRPVPDEWCLVGSAVVTRYGPGRYAIIRLGSGSCAFTDALGAQAMRGLMCGQTVGQVRAAMERACPGAGERYDILVRMLSGWGILGQPALRRTLKTRSRVALMPILGVLGTWMTAILRMLPGRVLAWWCVRRESVFTTRNHLSYMVYLTEPYLAAAGYGDMPAAWRARVAVESFRALVRTNVIAYLSAVLPHARLRDVLDHLLAPEAFAELARPLRAAGGGVVATLHTDMFLILPPYLATHGFHVAVLGGITELFNPLAGGDDLLRALPPGFDDGIDSFEPNARALLRDRLRQGKVVVIAFDAAQHRAAAASTLPTTEFLNHRVRCFFGPAWVAVYGAKPLIFTYIARRGGRVVFETVASLPDDPSRPERERIGALTEALYRTAETSIRTHPEAWLMWNYVGALDPAAEAAPRLATGS